MRLAHWFEEQLAAGAETVIWALAQVPRARWQQQPPFGGWSPARHLFHLLYYEETRALPIMRLWQGGSMPPDLPAGEEIAWGRAAGVEALVEAFRAVRQEQIVVASELADADWTLPRLTPWGQKNLRWVVTKTTQHTLDHGNSLLQMALFWDDAAGRGAVRA